MSRSLSPSAVQTSGPSTTRALSTVPGAVPAKEVPNSWVGHKGPGSLDLRSDTQTTPTASMLQAIIACTLRDDVMREDQTTNDLEAYMAKMTGKEAGLFVLSGTMGNQLALRSLLSQPPYGVLCDHRSHIVQYEAGGVSSLTGAHVKTVVPRNNIYLTLEDIQASVVLGDDVHACPTRVISLENTLNGMVMPLAEVRRIADFARAHDIRMHCDGARLWEAAASGAGTLPEFCALFDTVTMCFSKGLGAPVGSILVGTADTMKRARWTRKAIGGGLRQPGLLTAAARVAVDEAFGPTPDGQSGLLRQAHELAKKVEEMWAAKGGKFIHPVETNMCWLDLDAAGCSAARLAELGREAGLTLSGNRIVTHYQVAMNAEEVLSRLDRVFTQVFSEGSTVTEPKVGASSMYT
ncbi:pyridoxal phosphate-dependent transferase [Stachybotrys elegans]|uniref:Pyridoxal phosphate-dependent transferase n=1 Tax=Stachybotrys elegans TaxID=80388 RepID=A0A8K0SX71_9HYPO|nr:pyridoxal phosphate-dependent transferase [Stachybotrys elegans]